MPMKVEFFGNTADEMNEAVKDYASKIKGTRGGRNKDESAAETQSVPDPITPATPTQGFNPGAAQTTQGFNPGAAQTTQGFNPGAPAGPTPEVVALVARVSNRIDELIKTGQNPNDILTWFRGQCGAEAANATLDQIKQVHLPKTALPALEGIAKMMAA